MSCLYHEVKTLVQYVGGIEVFFLGWYLVLLLVGPLAQLVRAEDS